MTTLKYTVRYVKPYFNRTCMANIPGGWDAEIVDGLGKGEFLYTGRCSSKADALKELATRAKERFPNGGKLIPA